MYLVFFAGFQKNNSFCTYISVEYKKIGIFVQLHKNEAFFNFDVKCMKGKLYTNTGGCLLISKY